MKITIKTLTLAVVIVCVLVVLPNARIPSSSAVSSNPLHSDFNGDGYDDLAIGAPFEDVGTITNAGAVNVLYGSSTGLQADSPDDQLWHQNKPGVRGDCEPYDYFGDSLAVGDFNNDGYDDLAVGVPYETIGTIEYAGAVNVLYGSSVGLQADSPDDQVWHQNKPGVRGACEPSDYFGRTLVSGDFNNDGYDDLAVGVPWEDIGTITNAGAVNVLYGSSAGLQADSPDDQRWHQNKPGVRGTCEEDDGFGYSLAVGDFNNDSYNDLAIGVPGETIGTILLAAGAVNVLYGSSTGLQADSPDDQRWHQNTPGVRGACKTDEYFGYSLAVGDFNNDSYDDLAIGVSYETIGTIDAGAVNVLYGSSGGLQASSPDDQRWHQNKPGIRGTCESEDNFGYSLAVGDFNNDSYDDLAVGVLYETIGTIWEAGAVNVLYGSSVGLQADSPDDQRWHQNTPGVRGTCETHDWFGHSLAARDFNNDSYDDLAIGAPYEDIGTINRAGAVNVLYGSSVGLQASSPDDQRWHQNKPGVRGACETYDNFGLALTG